jgi:aldose 1-epimerase
MDSVIILQSSRYVAGINPVQGGTLAYFGSVDDPAIEFVRPTPVRAYAEKNTRGSAGYPLVPYSNRIGDGKFAFDGVDYALAIKSPTPWHPIHGVGWDREWTVVSATPNRLVLTFAHHSSGAADREWPWSFEAAQTFDLDDTRLQWSLSVANRDPRGMPAGIGMHPFFPKSPAMELQFTAQEVWQNDERMLPTERIEVPSEWNFRDHHPVTTLAVDNCFAEWTGHAMLTWPDRGWSLQVDADHVFSHLVVFTSPARDSIALEPVSHANNALNLAAATGDATGLGLVVLAPGETLAGSFTMTPLPLEIKR